MIQIRRRSFTTAVALIFTAMLLTPTASAQYRSNGYYPPGEAGRLQFLIDSRYTGNPYDRNVYRKSRHHDPFSNVFRSSRHYQKKVAGSADSYVLRVYRNEGTHHGHSHNPNYQRLRHPRTNNRYGYPVGAYGSRARQISPYARSASVVRPHECPPPVIIQVPTAQPAARPIDPSQIEYNVVHLVKPEATQRAITETVVLPDGRKKTIIRSVPIEKAATPPQASNAETAKLESSETVSETPSET